MTVGAAVSGFGEATAAGSATAVAVVGDDRTHPVAVAGFQGWPLRWRRRQWRHRGVRAEHAGVVLVIFSVGRDYYSNPSRRQRVRWLSGAIEGVGVRWGGEDE